MTRQLPTGVLGRILALSLTILAAATAWLGVTVPVLDWYQARAEQLRHQEAIARRMAALVETLPVLRREAVPPRGGTGAGEDALDEGGVDAASRLLSGASDPLAAANLQQMIDGLAGLEGARISSQEILPPVQVGELRAIAVRLTVSAPFRSFTGLLLAFARSEVPMIATDIAVRGPTGTARDAAMPVESSLTVLSYRAARGDGR